MTEAPRSHRTPAPVADALGRGARVVTASARAARALLRACAEDWRADGLNGRQAPRIDDWCCWLEGLYARLAQDDPRRPLLLTPMQEELLWREVQAREAAAVVSPERLARLGQSGYGLLSAYRAHAERHAGWAAAHEDAEHFLVWAAAFDARCNQLGVMSRCRLEDALAGALRSAATLLLPTELLLVGFDRLTPAQEQLLAALTGAGVRVEHAPLAEAANHPRLVVADDEQREMEACALWARGRLEAHPETDSGQRIGILVPELRGMRAGLDRVFRRTLQPRSARGPAGGIAPYEFSLGAPLAHIPLLASALLLLRWLGGPLPSAEISSLLLGGFVAGNEAEALALAESDRKLRRAGLLTVELGLGTLVRDAARHPGLLPPSFHDRLSSAERVLGRGEATRRRSYADWVDAVPGLLQTLGWPGFRDLDSVAFQARERWNTLLGEMGRLSFAGETVTWNRFAAELREAARNLLFAPESHHAPVQILGIDEAAGLRFDAIWLLGANEGRWPRGGPLHPLLAPALQTSAGMPHSSAEADLALAQQQLRRVLASAPVVVASYASSVGGAEARPSPLLRDLVPQQASVPLPVEVCSVVREQEAADPVPWPVEQVAGGSEVLKRQSACGFQSFAARRLRAEPLEEESWGLDAGKRATLLHRALERLWSTAPAPGRLHTLDDLQRAMADGSLDAMLRAAIAASFAGAVREAGTDRWRARYLELEQQRLATRLRSWLSVEAGRAGFAVTALEQNLDAVRVGPLRLNLRVDRVDTVDGDRKLLLDYKTADRVSPALWNGDRPEEPQLPIYAVFGGIAELAGIAFAQIRAGKDKTRLHALAEDPESQVGGKARGAKPLTGEIWEGWHAALQALAEQFARGDAPVNPRDGAQTCRLCGLYGLCRVRSQADAATRLRGSDDE